jgi:antitoxin (DNA-binding transcriptional repressor) of toxin-antitoxin stability system
VGGEEIVILENGHELARVIPNKQPKVPRIPGIDEGKIIFAPDCEDPLPEDILKAFEGLDTESGLIHVSGRKNKL